MGPAVAPDSAETSEKQSADKVDVASTRVNGSLTKLREPGSTSGSLKAGKEMESKRVSSRGASSKRVDDRKRPFKIDSKALPGPVRKDASTSAQTRSRNALPSSVREM